LDQWQRIITFPQQHWHPAVGEKKFVLPVAVHPKDFCTGPSTILVHFSFAFEVLQLSLLVMLQYYYFSCYGYYSFSV